jgi:outer membrane protein OmpA-like peptidoglycan-associated protein
VLFAVGDATLDAEAVKALEQIAGLIKGLTNVMLVKGHCSLDDFPEGASEEQLMNLSLRRAKAAADFLVSKGVRPETLRVVGCSVHEPVAQRAYMPETRALNRRVEVEAMRTLVPELQDRPAAAKPAIDPAHAGPAKGVETTAASVSSAG